MALSLLSDPFFGDPFFGGLGDVFSGILLLRSYFLRWICQGSELLLRSPCCSGLPAGCSITTDVGDAGPGRDTGGRRRSRAIPIDLIEAHLPSPLRSACMRAFDMPSPSIDWSIQRPE